MMTVAEFRQYTLHPGRRDVLIDLFDREFVESQEAVGIRVLGQFRNADDPDTFVWMRGFADMEARRAALGAFYGGPVWAAHRDAANATMIDSDDVLLLRPVAGDLGLDHDPSRRPPVGATRPSSVIVAVLARAGDEHLVPAGGETVAMFESEHAENTFPALPVRLGEDLHVHLRRFGDRAAADELTSRLGQLDHLVLEPTSRSLLR